MLRRAAAFLLIFGFAAQTLANQAPSASPQTEKTIAAQPGATGSSHEPFVIEKYFTTVRYENDGTGERDLAVRIRVQSDEAAQQLSELSFNFNSDSEAVDVRYARVIKPDGTTTAIGPENVTEAVAQIAHDTPAYSNCKEKHVTISGLASGSILEYEVATRIVKPAAPSEFWFQYSFVNRSFVLDEQLEINVPQSRKLNVISASAFPHTVDRDGDRVIYRWKHSNLAHAPAEDSNRNAADADSKAPDVQVSTFANWQDIARWYATLTRGSPVPSSEVRSKTSQIIQNHTSQMEKIQLLYDFVSTKIRYVDIPLGRAGYQPHSATDVLANQYADSQDRHTLLAAMLSAAGIPSETVLVPYRHKLDLSLPSPLQLDHVITAVPLKEGTIWLDTSTEVAPFQLLASPLRNKSALVISGDGSGTIGKTPADPPFVSVQHVDIVGKVSELGKLSATAHYSMRGDNELALRLAFHKAPESQWKDLGQTILSLDGVHGEVASITANNPFDTHNPFEFEIQFTQSNFIDWAAKKEKTPLPLLAIGLPDAPENHVKPIELGSPLDVSVRLKLALPASDTADVPVGVSISRDYAEFKSNYTFADHTVTAERSVKFKMEQLPPARRDDYSDFARAIAADQAQALIVTNSAANAMTVPPSATPDDLLDAGLAVFNAGNARSAIPLFERLVQLSPEHKQAWNDLGLSYLRVGKLDEAAGAFRKQLEVNPSDEHANDYLGMALEQQQKYDEAAAIFRKQTRAYPLDASAHAALAGLLINQHDYAQATPELEKATILEPENAQLLVSLGEAYIKIGKNEEAVTTLDKAATMSPKPAILNDVAFYLADAKLDLDKAQHYAESAEESVAADLGKADMDHLKQTQLSETVDVGDYWDTLGWIYFQRGETEMAQRYIQSAWQLNQRAEVAEHLALIYEKQGDKERATHMFALALASSNSAGEARARLTLLLGGNGQIDDLVAKAKPELEQSRTSNLGNLISKDARADFLVLIEPHGNDARIADVRFSGGDEALRPFAEKLRARSYNDVFPDDTVSKLIRRGTLSCSGKSDECKFTLAPAAEIHATNY